MKKIKLLLLVVFLVVITFLSTKYYFETKYSTLRNNIEKKVRHNSIKYLSITDINGKELIINKATEVYFYIMNKFTSIPLIDNSDYSISNTTYETEFLVKFINLDDNLIDEFIITTNEIIYKDTKYTSNLFEDINILFKSNDLQQINLTNTSKQLDVNILNTEENKLLLSHLYRVFNVDLSKTSYRQLDQTYIIDKSTPLYIVKFIYSNYSEEFIVTPKEIFYNNKVYIYNVYNDINSIYTDHQLIFLN